MKKLLITCMSLALTVSHTTFASVDEIIGELQQQWAVAKYQTPEKEREKAFEALVKKAQQAHQAYPQKAEILVWEAIILSTYAGEKGGFGALGLVKDAKKLLEQAERIDGTVLNGSVYTSLGSLYYQVPGWPIGFGDDDKAEKYLKKGLEVAPNDIDANYFYGDFLVEVGKYKDALSALNKALNAPARAGRPIADQGRRGEIQQAITKAKSHL